MTARDTLLALYRAAVEVSLGDRAVRGHLPPVPAAGRILVIGAGKGAAAMALGAERHYAEAGGLDRIEGLVVTRDGYELQGERTRRVEIITAAHPKPDMRSVAAAERTLALAATARPADLVLVLLAGGASSLLCAPVSGLTPEAKSELTRAMNDAGFTIHQMNTVRRHLSRIKGGRLARAVSGARLVSLAISDVPGDDPGTIGSGPTVPDATVLADARRLLEEARPAFARLPYEVPEAVRRALADPANESPKPGDAAFARSSYTIVARPRQALDAAAAQASALGYRVVLLGDAIEGPARQVAEQHARIALAEKAKGGRTAVLSGGELTAYVNRAKGGKGGRSQEYALALARALAGAPGIAGLAADTDGIDGGDGSPDDPGGAMIFPDTLARAAARGLDSLAHLEHSDTSGYFRQLGDLVTVGAQQTNVNDFRAILIEA